MLTSEAKTKVPVQRISATRFVQLCRGLFLASLLLNLACSSGTKQSTAPLPARPTLTALVPNTATVGGSGTLILCGANFVPGASISGPPGLVLRNIRVNGPAEITSDYAIAATSFLGYFNVTVTTPGGTSEPARFTILPAAFQFGSVRSPSANTWPGKTGPPPDESLDVGIHAAQVPNLDGSETDAYLDVSFTDEAGHPVTVGDSYMSDMDNVSSPDDPDPGPTVTSYSFGLQRPNAGKYVLHIKSTRSGSFDLEIHTSASEGDLAALVNVPTYPGSSLEFKLVCHRDPFAVDLDGGGLQPAHGAFSFAQPLDSLVRLPSEAKVLGVVIYYDPVMDPSSFRASLDGSDITGMFHVRLGGLELVSVPLKNAQHTLRIQANTKAGLASEQEFHIQH